MNILKKLNRQTTDCPVISPVRIVQFGAGNFIRAFVDQIIQELNNNTDFNSSVVVVKVTPQGRYESLDEQDGLFHVHLEGLQQGIVISETQLVTCISHTIYPYDDYEAYLELAREEEIRFLISNTTEAGISYKEEDQFSDRPPESFPAKLTAFLYERYRHFDGATDKGCIIIPTELVVDNGKQLRGMILRYTEQWQLEPAFAEWIAKHNIFCNTLVDRIVSGFPESQSASIQNRIGYEDKLLVMGEPYHSWIIEAPEQVALELPLEQVSKTIKIVPDVSPYRQTKVRILNGLHTSMVPIGYLLGLKEVRDCIEHSALEQFLRSLAYQEIIPSMDLEETELHYFADSVFDRFRNPSIHHALLSIAVNTSVKMKTRILPTLQAYQTKYQSLPERIVFVIAVFIRFYKGEWQGETIPLQDDEQMIIRLRSIWQEADNLSEVVFAVLQIVSLWGQDITEIEGLQDMLVRYLKEIDDGDILALVKQMGN